MLDLIFRCRARMAIIYGRVSPGPIAGPRFESTAPAAALPAARKARHGEPAASGRYTVVKPMPTRVDEHPRRG